MTATTLRRRSDTTYAAPIRARARWSSRLRARLADDRGATTAEYAITLLAACGFAAVLVVLLRSEQVRSALMGIVTTALGMGAA